MFDEEADTIPLDVSSVIEALRTGTIEVVAVESEVLNDTLPAEALLEFEDTPVAQGFDLHPAFDDAPPTDKQRIRPTTDADWPPPPKPPTSRKHRRAGMYKAITSITKLTNTTS